MSLIVELKKLPYFIDLLSKNKTILCLVEGSRLSGITDSHSDYDIILISENPEFCALDGYLKYKDTKIHFYRVPYTEIISNKICTGRATGLCFMHMLGQEHVIYETPKGTKAFKYLFNNKEQLSKLGCYLYYIKSSEYVQNYLSQGFTPDNLSKVIYRLVYAKKRLFDESLDEEYINTLKRIKYIYADNPSKYEMVLEQALEDIRMLNNYYGGARQDLENESLELQNQLNAVVDN